MTITYAAAVPDPAGEQADEDLATLFGYLLLKASGRADQALEMLDRLNDQYGIFGERSLDDIRRMLADRGLIVDDDGQVSPTPAADRLMRTSALSEVFRSLKTSSVSGNHDVPHAGRGTEALPDTRPWSFGDPTSSLDVTSTLTNVFRRTGGLDTVDLAEDDLTVHAMEHRTTCATVLMIDISHSMILYGEDRITPAKQVALALSELIRTKFPKDHLDVITFGDLAQRVTVADIPSIDVGPFHTNTRDGLRLARQLLRRSRSSNRQIFMITDGKPSALTLDDGQTYKNSWGLDQRIVNKTLDEAVACRRDGITISTFMVATDPWLVAFVEELTKANVGRAFFTGLDGLGNDMFIDYIHNRRRRS